MIQTRDIDLRRLNSLTKYPSIPTYHAMGERGALLGEVVSFDGAPIIATERLTAPTAELF